MIRRGRTEAVKSLGIGLDERKPLLADGIVEDDAKSLLYVDMEELACNGDMCGELYKAIMIRPRENMSAATLRLLSSTKSGDV